MRSACTGRAVRLLAAAAPLLLLAAAPGPSSSQGPPARQGAAGTGTAADRRTGPSTAAPVEKRFVDVGDWVRILPAPRTPDAYTPPPGPRLLRPMRGPVTQAFGCTGLELEQPTADCPGGFHRGLDIAMPQGTPIRAAAAGIAYPFEDTANRYGNYVVVQHVAGYSTIYGHMARTDVAWGEHVPAGVVIGYEGSTGNSTGFHLHFEVRFAGTPVDPMPYFEGSPADPFPLPPGLPGAARDDWRGKR